MPSMVASAPRQPARFEIGNHESMPMSVSVQCPDCGKAYNVANESIGARANCKSCGATFTLSMSMDDTGKSSSNEANAGKLLSKTEDAAAQPAHVRPSAVRQQKPIRKRCPRSWETTLSSGSLVPERWEWCIWAGTPSWTARLPSKSCQLLYPATRNA